MNIKDLAFWIMILVVIVASLYLVYWVNTNSLKCIASPFTYGVSTIKSNDNQPVTMTCNLGKETFVITKNNITSIDSELDITNFTIKK